VNYGHLGILIVQFSPARRAICQLFFVLWPRIRHGPWIDSLHFSVLYPGGGEILILKKKQLLKWDSVARRDKYAYTISIAGQKIVKALTVG
jgi:hypothetical protein